MKYLSFDVGIKNLAYCSLNKDKKILDWGIINLNKDPKCQCGIQKECPKTATYQINVPGNNEVKYCKNMLRVISGLNTTVLQLQHCSEGFKHIIHNDDIV